MKSNLWFVCKVKLCRALIFVTIRTKKTETHLEHHQFWMCIVCTLYLRTQKWGRHFMHIWTRNYMVVCMAVCIVGDFIERHFLGFEKKRDTNFINSLLSFLCHVSGLLGIVEYFRFFIYFFMFEDWDLKIVNVFKMKKARIWWKFKKN